MLQMYSAAPVAKGGKSPVAKGDNNFAFSLKYGEVYKNVFAFVIWSNFTIFHTKNLATSSEPKENC